MFLFIDFWPIAVIKDSKCGRGGPSHKFVAGQHYKKNHLGDYVLDAKIILTSDNVDRHTEESFSS